MKKDDRILYSNFPKSKHHDMEWVLDFEEFVDEFVMVNDLVQRYVILFTSHQCFLTAFRPSEVLYAFGLDVGHLQYNTVDDSAIIVTVTLKDLRIVVLASPIGPASYVDVPLENIQHTTTVSVWNAESQAHRYAVTIELSQAVRNAWYHNAVGHKGNTMSIAFTSASHAKTLSEFLQQPKKAETTGRPTVMESQPINCSEAAFYREFARPKRSSTAIQRLTGVAMQANSLLSYSAFGEEAEIHHDTQRPASSVSSAVEGIDVSHPDTANREKTGSNTQIPTADAGGLAIEAPRPPFTLADVEFEESPGHISEGSTQQDQSSKYQDQSSKYQDQDYDSLYDISPRASRRQSKIGDNAVSVIHPELSRQPGSTHPDQLSKDQDQGYDSSYDISPRASRHQSKIGDNAVPAIRPNPLRPPGNNETLPVTEDGTIEKPPSSKLSRSLRTKDGSVEAGVESPSTLELGRAAGTLMKNLKTSKASNNNGIAASANRKVGLQKSRLIKKAKERRGKGQAPKEEDREHVEDEYDLPRSPKGKGRETIEDEYDLPRSPKAPVRTLEASMIQDKTTSQAQGRVIQQKPKPKKSAKSAILPSSVPSQRLKVQSQPAHASKPPPEKAVQPAKPEINEDAGNGSLWNIELNNSNEDHETSPKQIKLKRVAKKPARHSKEGKSKKVETQPKKIAGQASVEDTTKAKPAASLIEPRSRRTAALIANKRIQGLEGSDEIVDEIEESVSLSKKRATTTTNKQEIQPSSTEIPETKVLKDNDKVQASINGTAKNHTLSKDTVPSSRPDEYAESETSSVENVELVSTTTRHGIAQAETGLKTSLPPTHPELSVTHGEPSYGGKERGSTRVGINGDTHDRSPDGENGFIPESITEDLGAVSKKERSTIESDLGMNEEVRPLGMVGDAEDSHFQQAMPDMESIDRREIETMNDETSESGKKTATSQGKEVHSHMTGKEVQSTKRATQHASQTSIKPDRNKATSGVPRTQDPFGAKLSLLAPNYQATAATVKERASPHAKETSKASKDHKDIRSTGQVNDSKRFIQSETQDDVWIVQQQNKTSFNANSGLHKEAQAQKRRQKDQGPTKQSVQAEPEQNVGLIQPQQAVAKPNNPRLAVVAVGNKRKAVPDDGAREKRPKMTPSNEYKALLHGKGENPRQTVGSATSTLAKGKPLNIDFAEVQPPNINRKPEIISFSTEGPRNQGSASTKKPKPLNISTGMQTGDSYQAVPEKERGILKRKAASQIDDPALLAYEQPSKRQKPNITPPTRHHHAPQMIPEPANSIAVHEKPFRVSSQNTRVAENGSPMPSVHARNDRIAQTQGQIKDEEVVDSYLRTDLHTDDEKYVRCAEGDDLEDDPSLPLTEMPPPAQGSNTGFDRFSSNSKGKYGSPTAPSNFASMPAHYMFHDGTIVNSQTRENIVPSEPQDPFTGAGQVETSDFIRALRRKSGTEARSQADMPSGKDRVMNAKRRLPACTEDPDKTLVEAEPPRKQRKRDAISVGSTVTPSSSGSAASEGLSTSIEASSQESVVDAPAQWRRALEPHQGNMLGVLLNISHVSNVSALKKYRMLINCTASREAFSR